MSNDNSGTDGDDLPIISNGGWRVGAVYEGTDYHHVAINDKQGNPQPTSIGVPAGSLFLCTDIVTIERPSWAIGHRNTNEYAVLDVYTNSDLGYKHYGSCYWYAGHKHVRPENCRFKEHQSPLMMLALLGTK